MPARFTIPGTSAAPPTWEELEDVFALLAQAARSDVAPQEFYRTVLEQCVRGLAAVSGVVWLRSLDGAMQPAVKINWQFADDTVSRRAHESLLGETAANDGVVTVAPGAACKSAVNPSDNVLVLGPVQAATSDAGRNISTLAIIELQLRPNSNPATYRGCEQFLHTVCELATDFHVFANLRQLRRKDDYRSQLLTLSGEAHRQLKLSETAFAVANEGRRVVKCDRFTVLAARGRRCRMLATSGASRIERRSGVARRLEKLAERVRRTNEPAWYADGQSDALPPIAELLEQHAEESHARTILALPVPKPADDRRTETNPVSKRKRRRERPRFVLVAEQFDAAWDDFGRERMAEVANVCAGALYNALAVDRLPLIWLLRPLGIVKQLLTVYLPRTLVVLALVAAAIAALVYVPADFNVESPGTLQPAVKRDVFAPRSGLVEEVLVSHGTEVVQGQPLLRLRDPSLELDLKRVDGEMETAQRQLEAVRTTRTNRAIREPNPADAYRLSAEESELGQRLANLRSEQELLNHEREQLVVASPIAGRIVTWDVGPRLEARRVEPGEVLLTVANLADQWQLELDVPDNRIGYVLAAQQALRPDLNVRFRLSSDDRERHTGHIAEICQTAKIVSHERAAASPAILVRVAIDSLDLSDAGRRELRPGISARAQIACGQRSLGYVWLHDIWDAAMAWIQF